jgi:thiamine kinase-like enzyme
MNFKILYCDDNQRERENLELLIEKKLSSLNGIDVEIKCEDFDNSFREIKSKYDLLVLDLHDDNSSKPQKDTGVDVLIQNESQLKIQTIVYSSKNNEVQFFEEENIKKYSSFLKLIPKKHNSYDNLIEFVKGIIINKIPTETYYHLYNENDVSLRLSVERIGSEHFNYILYLIFEKYNSIITVKPMPSGWSGAVLFELLINNNNYVLKLSKDIQSLKSEHQNSIDLYNLFPDQLTTTIKQDECFSFDKSVFGFLIKKIDNSMPLLNYIINQKNELPINEVLNEIYISDKSLSNHYKIRIDINKKMDWSSIFEKINLGKVEWVKKSYEELKPIILNFYKEIDLDDLERISIAYRYKNIDINKSLDKKLKKDLVLSHGDFHANNILIQGKRPFIIDTGALGYQHWALDITRLIVSVFILGLDKDKFDFYDLERIEYYKNIGENIICLTPTNIKNGDDNYNALVAINWIIKNVKNIFDRQQYTLFEFQLALMKEFIQVSYRKETVPPNKRALALILADISLEKANENVE